MAIFHYIIVILTVFFGTVTSQECTTATGEGCSDNAVCFNNMCYPNFGICLNDTCPTGLTCIHLNGTGSCLNLSAGVAPTPATTMATSSMSTSTEVSWCKDTANNCVALYYLCNNEIYYNLMTVMCTKTCGRCGQATPQTTASTSPPCVDLSAPGRTTDCVRYAYLCNNSVYYDLMTQQCPRTCNRCPGTDNGTRPPAQPTSACADLVGADGTSNCASVAYLCRNSLYYSLMRQQCPRTCGYC